MSTLDLDGRLAEIAARPTTRRGVLAGAGGLAAAAALSRLPLDLAYGAPVQFSADPFSLGVASGDPAPRDVVLWTRLAPEPLRADGGMPPQARGGALGARQRSRHAPGGRPRAGDRVAVVLALASTSRSTASIRAASTSTASPAARPRAASAARAPRRSAASTTSRSRSSPARSGRRASIPSYRAIAREDIAFVAHLGDYTYEYGIANGWGPRNPQLPPSSRPRRRRSSSTGCATRSTRPTRTCRTRTRRTRSPSSGTTTRSSTTTWARTPRCCSGARTRTARSTSTCRCAASRSRTARTCRSTAASLGATSPSSASSTRASTATSRRAATASSSAAPRRWTRGSR